jgi:hypothetical protein
MQQVTGYLRNPLSLRHEIRLYHQNRPAVRAWKRGQCVLDVYDHYLTQLNEPLTAVDFGGWYLPVDDIFCLESSHISKLYYPNACVEPDIETHRPTYIPQHSVVCFKNPWFLKYATLENFVKFLKLWVKSTTVIVFEPRYVQHNHLKFKLVDLVKARTDFVIEQPLLNMWKISL